MNALIDPHPRPLPATRDARGGRGAHCARQPPQQPSPAHPHRGRHHAAHAGQDRTAEPAGALARRTGRNRPLGAVETGDRRDADRDLGAARQDRRGRTRRQGSARTRIDLARPRPALSRSVRLAGRPRRKARQSRSHAVPPGDAGACDRERRISPISTPPIISPNGNGTASGCRRSQAATPTARCRRGFIPAAARTSPGAFPTSCPRCICPAPSTASFWCFATAGCRVSTCCSNA